MRRRHRARSRASWRWRSGKDGPYLVFQIFSLTHSLISSPLVVQSDHFCSHFHWLYVLHMWLCTVLALLNVCSPPLLCHHPPPR